MIWKVVIIIMPTCLSVTDWSERTGLECIIGPAVQLSTASPHLGESRSGYMRFADYKPQSVNPPMYGTIWRASTAEALGGTGILFALLILDFG
ncbi:hypothetical protein HBI24_147920 [Parastagonospora nodorum]|nr:hypothetical protein HBH53_128180 [Parastagonospora nodorum]KAH4053001.1 hypothetical protein HBH49_093610 [Parastagonospora nodorum]KAH4068650.1 hypothetical protein HBH50_116790 [Parastagonospora nodorum]KAH4100241.1 hypothetical protein HBH48_018330 [Parastagonospora nodorum]KAH4190531.1 hypothetical protein HBH42_130220 [Parastagonospora nodorum]